MFQDEQERNTFIAVIGMLCGGRAMAADDHVGDEAFTLQCLNDLDNAKNVLLIYTGVYLDTATEIISIYVPRLWKSNSQL